LFTQRVPRPAGDAYLGILGPTLHAAVGDTMVVEFRNNTPYPASIHPHGVFYDKDAEGAPYADGTTGADTADDAVPTGHMHIYRWKVPERAGPGPMDPSSVVWMYHSHTDEVSDPNAGLVGAIVVTRAGAAREDGTPADVDRELVADFEIFDQNVSPYLDENIATFASVPSSVHRDDEGFIESNLKHSINGYLFGNMPMITLTAGERVRWYLIDLGNEVDTHSPHWHGNTVLMNGMNRTDSVQLVPGAMVNVDMVPDDPGTWLFHCHVNDHILAGMQTRYEVRPAH
jgi:hephaestin